MNRFIDPYFNGILSAIQATAEHIVKQLKSQPLFYWNPFCNNKYHLEHYPNGEGRNPYFIGILSAIVQSVGSAGVIQIVAILILLESFLQ